MSEVTLVDVPTQLVLGMQKKGRYADTPSVIGEIVQYARANGTQLAGMPVALMHESGREAAEKADREGTAVIDVAFPIAKAVKGSDVVKCYELPGGRMARNSSQRAVRCLRLRLQRAVRVAGPERPAGGGPPPRGLPERPACGQTGGAPHRDLRARSVGLASPAPGEFAALDGYGSA